VAGGDAAGGRSFFRVLDHHVEAVAEQVHEMVSVDHVYF